MNRLETDCCIAGGGPAGIMLGYLLARQGTKVVVLEKHKDFFRDFRGDTVHPSTLQVLHELGILEGFLKRPHQKTKRIGLHFNGDLYDIVDFTHLPTIAKYVAFAPQWEFLDFLADEGRKLENFDLRMSTKAEDLIVEEGRVRGVCASDGKKLIEIRAPLTVACDGRDSTLRPKAGLEVIDKGVPIDVLWFSVPRDTGQDDDESFGYIAEGGMLVTLNRDTYWQCAFLIEKGGFERMKAEGLDGFRGRVGALAPHLADRTEALKSWDDVKLLSVQVSRLAKWWREGFLAIGDAAHAMSPVGGVGINLALQDAIATARILGRPLRRHYATADLLQAVQKRREWPAKVTQSAQVFAHKNVIMPALKAEDGLKVPLFVKALNKFPVLRGLPARAIGLGPRPEHWPDTLP